MANVTNLLGLSYRARKIILGEEILKNFSKVKLLIIASDISIKSKERLLKKCYYYDVKYIDEYDSEAICKALGKRNIKAVGITDKGFADAMMK